MRTLLSLILLVSLFSCQLKNSTKTHVYPQFWSWIEYEKGTNWDSLCMSMSEIGIDGMLLKGDKAAYEEVIPIATEYGIDVHAWLWTVNQPDSALVADHPYWYSVNRNGVSLADKPAYVDYYRFLSPAVDSARLYVLGKVRELCQIDGLKGVSIDYHRYVDVVLPPALWEGYGIIQDKEYAEWDYGYHPEMIEKFRLIYGYSPLDCEDPSKDERWLEFRYNQITDFANEIAAVVHSYDKLMSASPFPTPTLARKMVRQDWAKWNLDLVFPMVYHKFYERGVDFITESIQEDDREKKSNTALYCGLYIPDFKTDTVSISKAANAAMSAGASGLAIFTVKDLDKAQLVEFKAITKKYQKKLYK